MGAGREHTGAGKREKAQRSQGNLGRADSGRILYTLHIFIDEMFSLHSFGAGQLRSGFLNLGTINIWGGRILCFRGCPVHRRKLSSPLMPLNISRQCQMSPGGQIALPTAENLWSDNLPSSG